MTTGSDKIGNALAKFGGLLATTFGEKVLVGIIVQLFSDTTPGDCYRCIVENKTISSISEQDWEKYHGYAEKAHLKQMDMTKLMTLLKKHMRRHRSDLYSIIQNTPGGVEWLNSQISGIKQKLGI